MKYTYSIALTIASIGAILSCTAIMGIHLYPAPTEADILREPSVVKEYADAMKALAWLRDGAFVVFALSIVVSVFLLHADLNRILLPWLKTIQRLSATDSESFESRLERRLEGMED
ncbi:MAG: hypothetical protein KAW84_06235 [Thermoplasmata archaeon]|nr:hypothetical protein [Thermoplasmata archaeon]